MLNDCPLNQQGIKLDEQRSQNLNILIDSSTDYNIESSSQTSTSSGYNYSTQIVNSNSDQGFSSSSSPSLIEQNYPCETTTDNNKLLHDTTTGESRFRIQDLSVNNNYDTRFSLTDNFFQVAQQQQQQQQQSQDLQTGHRQLTAARNQFDAGHVSMNIIDLQQQQQQQRQQQLQQTINSSETTSTSTPVTAHSSEYNSYHHSVKYLTDQATKSSQQLANHNSSMALNFSSHDLLLQSNHQGHPTLNHHHQNGDNNQADVKHHLSNSLELDSGSLMQTAAANMNMWKSTMSLGHSFLPATDMGSFTANWPTHGGNHLSSHQATPQSMSQHILESQHLIGYQQHHHHNSPHNHHHHQRSMSHLTATNQDLVDASLKSHAVAEQATFMLNSINHQVNQVSQNSTNSGHSQSVNHHQTNTTTTTTTPANNDNLNLRTTQSTIDQSVASYNLALNDNHQSFYNSNTRNESNRSHANSVKPPVFLTDRSVPMSLSNHHHHHHHHHNQTAAAASQIASYHGAVNNDQVTQAQATSSHHITNGPSTSNGHSSRNIGSFRCPHCGEMFNMRNLYQSHLKTHSHEKGPKAKFHCEQCGHAFSQKTSLNRHMKSHTGERPFPCEVCGKAFSEKERLKIHMRTHTGEKPFSCSICGKSFSQKSTVKRHQTVHTGEKKFKCDCGKGFANRGNLIAHIKTRGANHFE